MQEMLWNIEQYLAEKLLYNAEHYILQCQAQYSKTTIIATPK